MKRFCAPQFFPLVPLLALAGCGGGSIQEAPMFCPQVAVLQQASSLTGFLPGRSDVAAQVTSARITGVAGACTLREKKHVLDVKFQAGFAASNGPANHGNALTLPYFVAITEGDTIINEYYYNITLKFDGNASTAEAVSKPVKIKLSNRRISSDVQILVGFQMTPEQRDYAAEHPLAGP